MALSKQTVTFLLNLLSRTQIATGAPDWRQTAAMTAMAQDELSMALAELEASEAPAPAAGGAPEAPPVEAPPAPLPG